MSYGERVHVSHLALGSGVACGISWEAAMKYTSPKSPREWAKPFYGKRCRNCARTSFERPPLAAEEGKGQ